MADTTASKGVSPVFVGGVPLSSLNAALAKSGKTLFTTPKESDENKFWSSKVALVETPEAEVFEVGMNAPRRINSLSFEIARFPHRGAVFYADAKGAWKPVLSEGGAPLTWTVTDSIPAYIPTGNGNQASHVAGRLVGKSGHPTHFGAGHWVKKSWVFKPLESARFRIVMTRRVGVHTKPPLDTTPKHAPVAYPVGVRHFDVGFKIRNRDDIPLTLRSGTNLTESETFASTTDMLGSPVDFSVRENRATDLIKGAVWRSEPQPISSAVVNLYMDARDSHGEPQVVDRFLLDPVTTGVHLNLYYSNQVPPKGRFQASDDPLSFPMTRVSGSVRPSGTGLLFDDSQTGYVDIDNSAVKFNSNNAFWIGLALQPQFDSTAPTPHVFLDTGELRLEWTGSWLQATLGSAVIIRTDLDFIANEQVPMVLSYDGADEFAMYANGQVDTAIPYGGDSHWSKPTTLAPTIRIGGLLGGKPGTAAMRLSALIIKSENPPGVEVYEQFFDQQVDFVVKPVFRADDLSTTDNAVLRYAPSLQTSGDTSLNPFGFVGGTGDQYGLIEWTPVNRDFKLHKGYLVFDPVKARYFKFEFTNLAPQPYDSYTPVSRKVSVFPNYLTSSPVKVSTSNNKASAIALQASSTAPKFADEVRLYLNNPSAAKDASYGPTQALYSTDPVVASRLRDQSNLYNFQPWQKSPVQPQFSQVGTHTYETVEILHTSRVAYFVAINSISMYRLDHATTDDTDQYLELFHDTANIDDSSGDLGGWTFADGGIFIPYQDRLSAATVTSKTFGSRRSVIGLQFASQQSPPVQLLPDPDFDDPALTNWVGYGDAAVNPSTKFASDLGTTVLVQRDQAANFWSLMEDRYDTWDDVDGSSWNLLQGVAGSRSFGGVASAKGVTVSDSGRVYAAARVYVTEPLNAPLYVQVVNAAGDVLSQEPMLANPGQVAEWFTSYTIGESGQQTQLSWNQMEASLANWDAVQAKGFWDQVDTSPTTTVGDLFARVVQSEPTLDSWYMDSLSVYDDSLIWEFSNDGGDSWYPVYDIRNDPHGCFMFPSSTSDQAGHALRWRVTGSRGGQQVNALVVRPLYDTLPLGQPFRDTIQAGGPNLAMIDQYPPITQDARFKLWSKPVPEDWWYGFRQWTLTKGGDDISGNTSFSPQIVLPERISEVYEDNVTKKPTTRLYLPEEIPVPHTEPVFLPETLIVPEEG